MVVFGVMPAPLFDPAREGPPADAVDVQLRMPRSMQVWVDDLARGGRDDELARAQELFEGLTPALVVAAQQFCGRVAPAPPAPSAGRGQDAAAVAYDARIAVTAVVEARLAGQEPGCTAGTSGAPGGAVGMPRPHVHLYLGGFGWRLDTGQAAPLAAASVRRGAEIGVWGAFFQALRSASEERFGLVWDWSAPSGSLEVVDPPCAARGEEAGYAVCTGRWGPRRLVLADAAAIAAGEAGADAGAGDEGPGPLALDGRPLADGPFGPPRPDLL